MQTNCLKSIFEDLHKVNLTFRQNSGKAWLILAHLLLTSLSLSVQAPPTQSGSRSGTSSGWASPCMSPWSPSSSLSSSWQRPRSRRTPRRGTRPSWPWSSVAWWPWWCWSWWSSSSPSPTDGDCWSTARPPWAPPRRGCWRPAPSRSRRGPSTPPTHWTLNNPQQLSTPTCLFPQ